LGFSARCSGSHDLRLPARSGGERRLRRWLPLAASLAVFLPLVVIVWAFIVIGVRWLLGF
jgi:hypothetical protein